MARRPTTKNIVLQTLAELREAYGLQIIRACDGAVLQNSVYTILHRAETEGLVSSDLEEKEPYVPGNPRRFYTLTEKGWEYVSKLAAPNTQKHNQPH